MTVLSTRLAAAAVGEVPSAQSSPRLLRMSLPFHFILYSLVMSSNLLPRLLSSEVRADLLHRAVEEKKQERAIAKQITPEITESQSSLKERYPPAVLGREVARTSRSEQGRSNSAPPPEYSDEKSQVYVDQQRRGYEYQAPPPMYEKVEERL